MPRPNSLPERLTVFEPITGWKSLCIIHLAPYPSRSLPTDFPEEALIETRIGWVKEIGGLRKVKLRGLAQVNWKLLLSLTAFNLLHLRNVLAGTEAAARREAPA
jgi:hypothetical protein